MGIFQQILTFGKLLRGDLIATPNGSSADVCNAKRALGFRKLNLVEDLVRSQ